MASWNELKSSIAAEKQALDEVYTDQKIRNLVVSMNNSLARYTSNAGISQNPSTNVELNAATEKFTKLNDGIKSYASINKRLSEYIRSQTTNNDVSNKLKQVGTLRDDIAKLEKNLKDVKNDLETSKTRQENVELPRQDLSYYQGFSGMIGINRPIKKHSVAFLIGFGLFLLFMSGLLLREFFLPSSGFANTAPFYNDQMGLASLFTDSRFYSVLMGVTLTFVVTGILAYSGYLGKTL